MTWETIELGRAASEFGIFDYATGMAPNTHPDVVWPPGGPSRLRIALHRGDLVLPDLAFETTGFVAPEADMLIVDGDLTIEGDLDVEQFDVGTPGYLLVKGHLRARSLLFARQFELLVWGDVTATEAILGEDLAGGSFRCAGTVSAPMTVLADFRLSAGAATGTVLAQRVPGESAAGSVTLRDAGAARIRTVEIDEAYGEFWLLELPEGVTQDDLETPDDFAAHAVLTGAALAEYEGSGGPLSIKQVIRKLGAGAFQPRLLGA